MKNEKLVPSILAERVTVFAVPGEHYQVTGHFKGYAPRSGGGGWKGRERQIMRDLSD